MASSDHPPPGKSELPSSRLAALLGPFIGVAAFTAAIAIVAAVLDWYRYEMLLAAAAVSCAAALPSFFLIYRQLAERKAAQVALRDVQARVGGMVEAAMDAMISIDEEQRIVLFNGAAERVFRWPRAAVLGQRIDMLLPQALRAGHRGHIERFGRTATTSRSMGSQAVLNGLRADGEEFPIEASISQHDEGGRKLYTVILRDVTQRLEAERLLGRSEARLRGILDSAMDAIITVDSRHHVVLFNRAAEDVFGCPRDQAIGAPLSWFIPERFRHSHSGLVQRFGETGASSRRMGAQRIVMGLRRDGTEFPIDASISHIVEEGEHFYTVILRDVTDRVKGEEALRESREEIRSLALTASTVREQEKSRFARELHDELGQALTALKIDVGWLREHLREAPEAVLTKLGAMQVLLDGTVAAARRISADLRPLMLDDLGLVAACEWLAHNFQQRTGIACELVLGSSGELDLPDPYATAVFRVLQESLTNIAKHAQATRVEATLERSGNAVNLTVRDNGRGFSPSGPRKSGSYGLVGLRERAYLLSGDIRVESAPGKGTYVEMHIPMSEHAEAAT